MPTRAAVYERPGHKPKQAWATRDGIAKVGGRAWQKLRELILSRDSGLCQTCAREGKLTAAEFVDHVKPRSQGGGNSSDNLESICKKHHDAKTAKERAAGRAK